MPLVDDAAPRLLRHFSAITFRGQQQQRPFSPLQKKPFASALCLFVRCLVTALLISIAMGAALSSSITTSRSGVIYRAPSLSHSLARSFCGDRTRADARAPADVAFSLTLFSHPTKWAADSLLTKNILFARAASVSATNCVAGNTQQEVNCNPDILTDCACVCKPNFHGPNCEQSSPAYAVVTPTAGPKYVMEYVGVCKPTTQTFANAKTGCQTLDFSNRKVGGWSLATDVSVETRAALNGLFNRPYFLGGEHFAEIGSFNLKWVEAAGGRHSGNSIFSLFNLFITVPECKQSKCFFRRNERDQVRAYLYADPMPPKSPPHNAWDTNTSITRLHCYACERSPCLKPHEINNYVTSKGNARRLYPNCVLTKTPTLTLTRRPPRSQTATHTLVFVTLTVVTDTVSLTRTRALPKTRTPLIPTATHPLTGSLSLSLPVPKTLSAPHTHTISLALTQSVSLSLTPSASRPTRPATRTQTWADTATLTLSHTLQRSVTSTETGPSAMPTASRTPQGTATASDPHTQTVSSSATHTFTASASMSASASVSTSATLTFTSSGSASASLTASASRSLSASASSSQTTTVSFSDASLSLSQTVMPPKTPSLSLPPPPTGSGTASQSLPLSASPPLIPTPSAELPKTDSMDITLTASVPLTAATLSETKTRSVSAPSLSSSRTIPQSLSPSATRSAPSASASTSPIVTVSTSFSESQTVAQTASCDSDRVPQWVSNTTCYFVTPTTAAAEAYWRRQHRGGGGAGKVDEDMDEDTPFPPAPPTYAPGCDFISLPYGEWGGKEGTVLTFMFKFNTTWGAMRSDPPAPTLRMAGGSATTSGSGRGVKTLSFAIASYTFDADVAVSTMTVALRYDGPNTMASPGVMELQLPSEALKCPLGAPLIFTIHPLAAPKSEFSWITDIIKSIVAAMAVVSASPAVAAQMGIINGLQEMARCEKADLTEELEIMDSPLGLAIGDEWGAPGRGCIAGTFIIMTLFTVLIGVLAFLYYQLVAFVGPGEGRVYPPTWRSASAQLGFPGVYLIVTALLIDATFASGVGLVLFGLGPSDIALGIAALVACVAYVGSMYYATLSSPMDLRDEEEEGEGKGKGDTKDNGAADGDGVLRIDRLEGEGVGGGVAGATNGLRGALSSSSPPSALPNNRRTSSALVSSESLELDAILFGDASDGVAPPSGGDTLDAATDDFLGVGNASFPSPPMMREVDPSGALGDFDLLGSGHGSAASGGDGGGGGELPIADASTASQQPPPQNLPPSASSSFAMRLYFRLLTCYVPIPPSLRPTRSLHGGDDFMQRYSQYVQDLRCVSAFRAIELTAVCIINGLQAAAYGDPMVCLIELSVATAALIVLFVIVVVKGPMAIPFERHCTAISLGLQSVAALMMLINVFLVSEGLDNASVIVIMFATIVTLGQAAVGMSCAVLENIRHWAGLVEGLRQLWHQYKRQRVAKAEAKARRAIIAEARAAAEQLVFDFAMYVLGRSVEDPSSSIANSNSNSSGGDRRGGRGGGLLDNDSFDVAVGVGSHRRRSQRGSGLDEMLLSSSSVEMVAAIRGSDGGDNPPLPFVNPLSVQSAAAAEESGGGAAGRRGSLGVDSFDDILGIGRTAARDGGDSGGDGGGPLFSSPSAGDFADSSAIPSSSARVARPHAIATNNSGGSAPLPTLYAPNGKGRGWGRWWGRRGGGGGSGAANRLTAADIAALPPSLRNSPIFNFWGGWDPPKPSKKNKKNKKDGGRGTNTQFSLLLGEEDGGDVTDGARAAPDADEEMSLRQLFDNDIGGGGGDDLLVSALLAVERESVVAEEEATRIAYESLELNIREATRSTEERRRQRRLGGFLDDSDDDIDATLRALIDASAARRDRSGRARSAFEIAADDAAATRRVLEAAQQRAVDLGVGAILPSSSSSSSEDAVGGQRSATAAALRRRGYTIGRAGRSQSVFGGRAGDLIGGGGFSSGAFSSPSTSALSPQPTAVSSFAFFTHDGADGVMPDDLYASNSAASFSPSFAQFGGGGGSGAFVADAAAGGGGGGDSLALSAVAAPSGARRRAQSSLRQRSSTVARRTAAAKGQHQQ